MENNSKEKKHEADKVHTPAPPQHMNPSVPPQKQRGPQENDRTKKTSDKEKSKSGKEKTEKLTPREEL